MLVIVTERQVLPTERVCSGCLMADNGGSPRWRKGKLGCGHLIDNRDLSTEPFHERKLPQIYECQMGFHVTNIK